MNTVSRFVLISAAFIGFVYLQSLQYPLLKGWDDPQYITRNQDIVRLDVPHVKKIFSSFYMGNYAPVQILSYALDYRLFGPDHRAFRAVNLFLHFMNSILVFLLIRKISRAEWVALIGGLLFAVHPLQVESVAWISQRKNILSTLFLLLAFLSYLYYRDRKKTPAYWTSLAFFALGLLAKISIIVLPAYLLLYDHFIWKKRPLWKETGRYVPFAVLAAAAGFITLKAQSVGGIRMEYYGNSWIESALLAPGLWWKYFQQILFPMNLSALYDAPLIVSLSAAKAATAITFLAALVLLVSWGRRNKKNTMLFWLSWFIVGLMPVSHLIPMVTIMNDRYLYFPIIGAFVLLASPFSLGSRKPEDKGRVPPVVVFVMLFLVFTFSLLARERTTVWSDDLSLWSDAVGKYPNQAKARSNRAACYMEAGDYWKAIHDLEKALVDDPDLYVGRLNLGLCYLELNNPRAAIRQLRKTVSIFDGDPTSRYYLGMAYHFAGENEQAIPELRWVVEHFPVAKEASLDLIRIYKESGRIRDAKELIASSRLRYKNDIAMLVELGKLADNPPR